MTSFWQNLWRWMLGGNFNTPPAPPPISPPTAYIPPKPVPPAPPKPPTQIIIAGRGDTLFTLAEKHHTTVQAIARLNNIHPQRPLHTGQRLIIPDFDAGELPPSAPEADFIPSKSAPKAQITAPAPKSHPPKPEPVPRKPAPKKEMSAPAPKPLPIKPTPAKPISNAKKSAPKTAPIPATPEKPFAPPAGAVAALYLSHHSLGIAAARDAVLAQLTGTPFNTVVIDFKDDWGYLSHPVPHGLATRQWGNFDLPALVASLREKNVRTVARVVTLKDNLVARTMPHLATQMAHNGDIWLNAENFAWLDPFQPEGWSYLKEIVRAAAEIGFAEVQLDALHFPAPSANGVPQLCRPATPANRGNTIAAFLSTVHAELSRVDVALSLTVDGYACHRTDDFGTGQDVARLAAHVDALAPLVYPSHFTLGLPGCPDPLGDPARAVESTVRAARQRLGDAIEIRPWLQDFPWDANGAGFSPAAVNAQIRAAFNGGADGFGLWRVA